MTQTARIPIETRAVRVEVVHDIPETRRVCRKDPLANPGILILDEATASVDTITEMGIQRALTRLLETRTALVIAHRLSTIRHADRIYVVQACQIVEAGSDDELLRAGGPYTELYRKLYLEG